MTPARGAGDIACQRIAALKGTAAPAATILSPVARDYLSRAFEGFFRPSRCADFQPGSLPACTALSCANKSAGRFDSPLPDGRFLQQPDQCFQARRLPPLARDRLLVTAFRSPATVAASQRPPFRGQSSQPATSLPSELAFVPVRPFGSTTASRIAPVAAVSLPVARCTATTRFGWPRLRSPLPSGTFASLGIKAFNRVCCLPVRLANPPDFLSLPAARPD
jgi:hypothetical protein